MTDCSVLMKKSEKPSQSPMKSYKLPCTTSSLTELTSLRLSCVSRHEKNKIACTAGGKKVIT